MVKTVTTNQPKDRVTDFRIAMNGQADRNLAKILEQNVTRLGEHFEKSFGIELLSADHTAIYFKGRTSSIAQVESAWKTLSEMNAVDKINKKSIDGVKMMTIDLQSDFKAVAKPVANENVPASNIAKIDNYQPMTQGQAEMYKLSGSTPVLFGIGVAGSGKTRAAVERAVWDLQKEKVDRIILSRPAVEAGEPIGFLPGEMKDKMDPYMQPLYDELKEVLGKGDIKKGAEQLNSLMSQEKILIIPTAFVRGRTFKKSAVIIDEAQNCTWTELKTIITRLGAGSSMVITGDPEQIDLTPKSASGLNNIMAALDGKPGFARYDFQLKDIVRRPEVKTAVEAFQAFELAQEAEIEQNQQPNKKKIKNYGPSSAQK